MPRIMLLSTCFSVLATAPLSAQDTAPLVDVITINANRTTPTVESVDARELASHMTPDTTSVVARLPGFSGVSNGPLSAQPQYRGLFGSRLNIRLNGRHFASGGPNMMDPPLHYAPLPLLESIVIDRGMSPVSAGPGLAGGMDARLKSMPFASDDSTVFLTSLTASAQSADRGHAATAFLGLASDQLQVHAFGARESGDDLEAADLTIGGSQYERALYGLGVGLRLGDHTLSLQLRRNETGPTGNPQFAMDIGYVDSDFVELDYNTTFAGWSLDVDGSWNSVEHGMNNFSLRPAPTSMMRYRETLASVDHGAWSGTLEHDLLGGLIELGLDSATSTHDVRITNPANSEFYLRNFPDIEIGRTGAFAQWRGPVTTTWQAEFGFRLDHHSAEAAEAETGAMVPALPTQLATAFNSTERNWEGESVDLVARAWRSLNEQTSLRLSLGRKTRAPGYVERFAWLPTPASGGLADGNTYIGDQDLEIETAWMAEAGIDHQSGRFFARPSVYIRRVDDYIQGVPFDDTVGVVDSAVEMVSMMNGDPTPLRFANVDAELYGIDADFGYQISSRWRLDGVVEYVRARRRDIDDNLYRVAPASLSLALSYEAPGWIAGLEGVWTAEQKQVSASNSEAASDGYTLWNAHARFDGPSGSTLDLRIDNLLDEAYAPHLSGRNRNAGSDLALGAAIPGTGRNIGLRLSWAN